MGKIYVGQTAIEFETIVGVDITGAICWVKYTKPDGSIVSLPATILDKYSGVITATPGSSDDLNQAGRYVFWGYVTFSNGRSAAGEPEERMIYPEGYIER